MEQIQITIDKVAYEMEHKGYVFKATYLTEPKGQALIEISKDGELVRNFLFPAYKIYNISAHCDDIVNGLEKESDEGLYEAGSNLLGGNSYNNQ